MTISAFPLKGGAYIVNYMTTYSEKSMFEIKFKVKIGLPTAGNANGDRW